MVEGRKRSASILKGLPEDLPSLSYAYRLTQRAARLGFDWPDLSEVLKKLDEELGEFREALSRPPSLSARRRNRKPALARRDATFQNHRRIVEEFGDILFVLVNVARFLRIDPEAALKKTIKKFSSRFHFIETSLQRKGKSVRQSNLEEMDRLWEEAKRRKKRQVKAEPEDSPIPTPD